MEHVHVCGYAFILLSVAYTFHDTINLHDACALARGFRARVHQSQFPSCQGSLFATVGGKMIDPLVVKDSFFEGSPIFSQKVAKRPLQAATSADLELGSVLEMRSNILLQPRGSLRQNGHAFNQYGNHFAYAAVLALVAHLDVVLLHCGPSYLYSR